jgi:hypothetical protein
VTTKMTVPVDGVGDQRDAEDKARRLAWNDGYKTLLVLRSRHVGPVWLHRWSVDLVVEKRA